MPYTVWSAIVALGQARGRPLTVHIGILATRTATAKITIRRNAYNLTMQADHDRLPQFRYHPDPVSTGSVVAEPVECVCCGERRSHVYAGPVYAVDELVRELCPWCIASGRAATMFDAQFTDALWSVPDEVSADV